MSEEEINKTKVTAIEEKNSLQIGVCDLRTIEERLKAFRIMNQTTVKKRYLLSRETLYSPHTGKPIIKKNDELDLSALRLIRRYFDDDRVMKIFQPDEGIVIVSNMSHPKGISFSMDLTTQIMNISGGVYEGFIDRVDSFEELLLLLRKVLFPRLLIIGYIGEEGLENETNNFKKTHQIDQYMRIMEVTHSKNKKKAYFSKIFKMEHIRIDDEDPYGWGRFIIKIVRNYTAPYFTETI